MNRKAPAPASRRNNRRAFLIGIGVAGLAGAASFFGFKAFIPTLVDRLVDEQGGGDGPSAPMLWFAVDANNGVVLYIPKGEMGQGVQTMIAQLAAEELDLAPEQLTVKIANSSLGFGATHGTFASSSTTSLYKPVRQAAATLREMVRAEAARQLGAQADNIAIENGKFFAQGAPAVQRSYPEIFAAKSDAWVTPAKPATVKPRSAFVTIGKSTPRVDVADKLTGKAQYAFNARAPGMLFGAVARPPRFEATLQSGRSEKTSAMPGVKHVLIDPSNNFAGVVADTRTRAQNAVAQLQTDLVWSGGSTIDQEELDALVTARLGEGTLVRNRGSIAGLSSNPSAIQADYRTPLAAHAHLEPMNALVSARADVIEAWLPTQSIEIEVETLQAALGTQRKVLVHGMQMGGSFGRKANQSAAVEAARLSDAAGAPVHVGWTREEEMRSSFYRQPSHSMLRGSVGADGRITALEHSVASGDILTGPFGASIFLRVLERGFSIDPGLFTALFSPYAMSNYHVRTRQVPLPVPTGLWRGLALLPNVFALESFTDELATQAGIDPLAFRLNNLPDDANGKRLRAVLERVRDESDWSTPSAGIGRGVACSISTNTAVAMVAEVSVRDKQIIVQRVTVAVDPGLVVNPAGARLQAVGSVVMGLSSTLIEKITVKNGAVKQSNFDNYPLLRLIQTPPRIDVHFVDSGLDPQGMGEPVLGPIAAAVANAVFALTGQRLRELPLMLT